MSFTSYEQQKAVMALLNRRLAKIAGVTRKETRGILGFKYHPIPHSLRSAWVLDPSLPRAQKKIVHWEQLRDDSGNAGHYNRHPAAIWVRNNKVAPIGLDGKFWQIDLTEGEKAQERKDIKRTLKHEIGHHVWSKLPMRTQAKLILDDDFYRKMHSIKHDEAKHYAHNAETETFARLYTDVRNQHLTPGQKKIPYHQHRRKLLSYALKAIRRQR